MSKPLKRPFPKDWYLRTGPYRLFMIRELTSVFIAAYLVFILVWTYRLGRGPEAYREFMQSLRHPVAVVFHSLALAGALWHSITWFNLTPAVTPVRIGESKLPDVAVAIVLGYVPWIVFSIGILWIVLR